MLAAGSMLLTGCSALPDQADSAACEQLSTVLADKIANIPSGGIDAAALAISIESDVISIATEGMRPALQKVVDALIADPIDAAGLTKAGSELAIKCALVGVNLELPNPQDLLG